MSFLNVFRSYKNGFVWHDLAEDDLVLPATDGEYVLKGSELLDRPSSGKQFFSELPSVFVNMDWELQC